MRCKYSMPFTLRVWHWCCVWFMSVLIQTTFCCLLASVECVCVCGVQRNRYLFMDIYRKICINFSYQSLSGMGHRTHLSPNWIFVAYVYIYILHKHTCVWSSVSFPLKHGYRPAACVHYLFIICYWAGPMPTKPYLARSAAQCIWFYVSPHFVSVSAQHIFFSLYLMMNSIINYSSHRQE